MVWGAPGKKRGDVDKHLSSRGRFGSQESVQPCGWLLGEQIA